MLCACVGCNSEGIYFVSDYDGNQVQAFKAQSGALHYCLSLYMKTTAMATIGAAITHVYVCVSASLPSMLEVKFMPEC